MDNKLDKVSPLIADPPSANSTTMHRRLVRQDIHLYLGGTTFWPGPEKPPYLLSQCKGAICKSFRI